jgi:probable HAF family extracellular repeat protein
MLVRTISHIAAFVVLSLGSAGSALAVPLYHVSYLGFAFTNGFSANMNDRGQIVGNDGQKGFIYDSGQITTLSTLGGPVFGPNPAAINDAGVIVGSSLTTSFASHAFLYSNGSPSDLGALPGYPGSQATSINAAGDVVGLSSSPDGSSSRAFLCRNGTLTELGPGLASAINVSGTIVGTSGDRRAAIYQNGSVIDLENFGDSLLTSAEDVNDSGQIVGTSYVQAANNNYVDHPFLYESGVWHDLGLPAGVPLGIPIAINNLGQIVGNSKIKSVTRNSSAIGLRFRMRTCGGSITRRRSQTRAYASHGDAEVQLGQTIRCSGSSTHRAVAANGSPPHTTFTHYSTPSALLRLPVVEDNAAMPTERPKRNHRWFHFSLRTLLIGLTVFALIPCGYNIVGW